MEHLNKSVRQKTFVYRILIIAWFIWAVYGCWVNHAVFFLPEISIENRSGKSKTSTHFRYEEQFEETLDKYEMFGGMYQDEVSTAVPGLSYTKLGDSYSDTMVPQGISIAGDYMLITAYDSGIEGKVEPSVIYVLSNEEKEKRKFLTTLILPDRNHVGGITFDGEYIWIAKSTTGYISGISYESLQKAVSQEKDYYEIGKYDKQIYLGVTASFVTWDEERLWVGTHSKELGASGELTSYRIYQKQGTLKAEKECTIHIPAYAQGVEFVEWEEKIYMVLNASNGRYRDSVVYLYERIEGEDGLSLQLVGSHCFPPMLEELVSDGEHVYFVFESAATCYSTEKYRKCMYPVDRICGISCEELLSVITRK